MTGFLFETLVETYRAPRRAARRVIDTLRTPEQVGIVFGLSAVLSAIFLTLSLMARGGVDGSILGVILSNLMLSVAAFAVLVALTYGIGRMFGGTGGVLPVSAALAWHSLATVIFAPFISPEAMMAPSGAAAFVQLAIVGIVTWLMVNFIAEAHGFKSAMRTIVDANLTTLIAAIILFSFGSGPVKGFAAGEVLFLGASGSQRGEDDWEITFRFAASPNVTGLTIGDIEGIDKKGWEYLWVRYADAEDEKVLVKQPIAVYVERVYDEGNFAGLGIRT